MPVSREEAAKSIETLRQYAAENNLWSIDVQDHWVEMFARNPKESAQMFESNSDALNWAEQQRGDEYGG